MTSSAIKSKAYWKWEFSTKRLIDDYIEKMLFGHLADIIEDANQSVNASYRFKAYYYVYIYPEIKCDSFIVFVKIYNIFNTYNVFEKINPKS